MLFTAPLLCMISHMPDQPCRSFSRKYITSYVGIPARDLRFLRKNTPNTARLFSVPTNTPDTCTKAYPLNLTLALTRTSCCGDRLNTTGDRCALVGIYRGTTHAPASSKSGRMMNLTCGLAVLTLLLSVASAQEDTAAAAQRPNKYKKWRQENPPKVCLPVAVHHG